MKHILLITLMLFVCINASASNINFEEVQDAGTFLEGREVICSVDFAANSTQLSSKAQNKLKEYIPQLKQLNLDEKMIRIEGFASPEGNKEKNFRLSITRALAVESFLRVNHGVSLDHYITGYGPTVPSEIPAAGTRRVEIVIYDNPWNQQDVPVEMSGGQ